MLSALILLTAVALGAKVYAEAIGPVGNLIISDKVVSPDGFARDAVVVNGLTPGPLVRGNTVSCCLPRMQYQALMTIYPPG